MPILPAEPDLFPADLWLGPEPDAGGGDGRRWWCLHTRPRQEKAAAREFRAQQIPFYLPQVVHESRTPQGRLTRSVLPLFGGYLFLRGDDRERLLSVRNNRLVRVMEVPDQRAIDRDLRQIHRMLTSGQAVVPEPAAPVGARVKILNGPLAGLVGRVIRRGKHDQFVAVVEFLGSGATVDLRDWQVEPLPDGG